MILDGYGLNPRKDHNAVALADTPVMDRLMKEYPFVQGQASGLYVGLPDGQMGNSEVGHLNMGAGRIVYQDLTRITKAIQDGDFFENEVLVKAMENVKAHVNMNVARDASHHVEVHAKIHVKINVPADHHIKY
jgi:2,3-bisphosphoglycerate-independent phosphoglycerate mutase